MHVLRRGLILCAANESGGGGATSAAAAAMFLLLCATSRRVGVHKGMGVKACALSLALTRLLIVLTS